MVAHGGQIEILLNRRDTELHSSLTREGVLGSNGADDIVEGFSRVWFLPSKHRTRSSRSFRRTLTLMKLGATNSLRSVDSCCQIPQSVLISPSGTIKSPHLLDQDHTRGCVDSCCQIPQSVLISSSGTIKSPHLLGQDHTRGCV